MIDWENDVRADIMESGKAGSGKAAGKQRGGCGESCGLRFGNRVAKIREGSS